MLTIFFKISYLKKVDVILKKIKKSTRKIIDGNNKMINMEINSVIFKF